METVDSQQQRVKSASSRFCQPFCWEKGHLNDSSYKASCKFAGELLDQHSWEVESVLRDVAGLIERAGDTADPGKLIQQFSDAFAFVSRQRAAENLGAREFLGAKGKWPEAESELIESCRQAFAHCSLGWWENISPVRASTPAEVLPWLFPSGSLVCYGLRENRHVVSELGEELSKLAAQAAYIVPNPAEHLFVQRPDGLSRKCGENFPERRFLIVEFDRKKIDPGGKLSLEALLDLQGALHAHLEAERAPLELLVYSGHVSLHGWYPCLGIDECKVLAFLRYACRLGADHCLSAKSFFTRMPGGVHENGKRQTVHYFNPKTL
jgi:hypothetical protein